MARIRYSRNFVYGVLSGAHLWKLGIFTINNFFIWFDSKFFQYLSLKIIFLFSKIKYSINKFCKYVHKYMIRVLKVKTPLLLVTSIYLAHLTLQWSVLSRKPKEIELQMKLQVPFILVMCGIVVQISAYCSK